MLRALEGLAPVMVGTGVLPGVHPTVLVPSKGLGAATRWGSQAAQLMARTSACTALPQRGLTFAMPRSALSPPQGRSSRVYLCTC